MRKTIISIFTAILFITALQLILDYPSSIAFAQTDDHGNTKEDATHITVGIVRPGVVDVGALMRGVIETAGDVDYFRVEVTGAGKLTVYTTGDLDTVGELQDYTGKKITDNDDGGNGTNFRMQLDVNSSIYYLKVQGYGNDTGNYIFHAGVALNNADSTADLVVQLPWVSPNTVAPGADFELGATIKNQGDALSPATTVKYYRSTDEDISAAEDTKVGTDDVKRLAVNGRSDVSITIPAPDTPGTYYYGVCVDGVKNEAISNNNCSTAIRITVEQVHTTPTTPHSYIYWTDSKWGKGKIMRANLDGTEVKDLVTGLDSPYSLALDVSGGRMYWTDNSTDKIQRANLDGTGVQDIVTGLDAPYGLVLDVSDGKMYWTDVGTDKIQRANLDGTGVQDLLITGLVHPGDLALDVSGGKIYWTDNGTNKIQRANLDGTNIEDIVTAGLVYLADIALDVSGGKMYWTDSHTDKIQRANLDGTGVQDLVTGLDNPRSIALDVSGGPTRPIGHTDPATNVLPLVSVTDLDLSHGGDVRCVAYSPSGVVLASGGTDDYMRLWRTSNGEALATYKHGGDINSIAFSPNDTWIASGSDDGKVRLYKWSTADDTWIASQEFDIPGGALANNVKSVAFSYDNTMLACGTSGYKVFVWDYDPDQDKWIQRSQPLGKHSGAVNSVAFSPWGVVLASASDDNTVRLWHAHTGELLNTLDNHTDDVNCVTFSRDDAFIATGSDDDTVILWKWSTSDDTWVFHELLDWHDDDVRSVAFNSSGSVLLSASADRTIGVWDGHTGDYHTSLVEHTKSVNSIACNFQGNAIASGSDDGIVRQLAYTDAADIPAQGISLTLPSDLISEVAFVSNTTYFIFSSQYPTLTGINAADIIYEDCVIILDLPGVPDKPVDNSDSNDQRLDNPAYFMYPLETPRQRLENIEGESGRGVLGSVGGGIISTVAGFAIGAAGKYLGTAGGFVVGVVIDVIQIKSSASKEKERIFASTADPIFILSPFDSVVGLPPGSFDSLFLFRGRMEQIKIKVILTYRLKSEPSKLLFDPVRTVTYEGTWDLEDGVLTAPGAHLMSLSDYPPFQLLPTKVREYLLRHFGEFMTVREWQIPETTALLPNYPNPFNPETWVPYQLAKPADVTLKIYDINGRVIRTLDLGHQRAGMYHSRTRAAHWDGKNEVGESVASGIYFYVLKAGDFSATRKMLIKK